MDPWQAQKKEPKAPDKNIEALTNKDSNIIMKIKPETPYSNCGKPDSYSQRVLPAGKDSSVSSLNEPDLKALLEEAMAYKRPKDIQGKSDLFKELLQSVESEKKYTALTRSEKPSGRKPRRKHVSRKEIEKTPDFQDVIVSVSDCDDPAKRQIKYSLKCSPNTEVVPINPASICDENNPEIAELLRNGTFDSIEQFQQLITNEANVYRIQPRSHDANENRVTFPLPMNFAAELLEEARFSESSRLAVKDISTFSSGQSKECTDLSVISNERASDSKRSYDENGNALSSSRMDSLAERKAKARRLKAKNDKNIILSQHIEGHRSDIAQDIDALIKYIESPKRTDTKPGRHRNSSGISSKHSSRAHNKITTTRDNSSDTLSRKTQKEKDDKLLKSTSLEDVSLTKFEDLTKDSEDKRNESPVTLNNNTNTLVNNLHKMKESHFPESACTSRNDKYDQELFDSDFLPVTKKSRKKKYETNIRNKHPKANDSSRHDRVSSGCYRSKVNEIERFRPPAREFPARRKSISSVPSSDKSGDTSDMDSVHSFPVSSSKGKGKANVSVSGGSGSTPQISYADIARSAPSPTRNELFSKYKGNVDNFGDFDDTSFCSPQEPIPTVVFHLPPKREPLENSCKSHEEYPPLDNKSSEKNTTNDMFVEYTVVVPKRNCTPEPNTVNVEETVLIEMPHVQQDKPVQDSVNNIASDSHLPSKRPPVILMASNHVDNNDINDLVFGFEINEQLLSNSGPLKASDASSNDDNEDDQIVPVVEESCALQVMNSPSEIKTRNIQLKKSVEQELSSAERLHLQQLADYVSSEWEKILSDTNDGSGKTIYFNEQ